MLTRHVALVSETAHIGAAELNIVTAALQKQVTRDFGPIWGVTATVNAFASLHDVPADYWPVIVQDDIHTPNAAGVHQDRHGQPFALVQFSNDWALTASHEILEMLGDPFGNRVVAGQSPLRGQGRVTFLVEVCDPSEARENAYTVNGITVSDFYTPHFFDPVRAPGVRYSFVGRLTAPRTILKGGYLSWGVPETNEWFQQIWFNSAKPTFRSLGKIGGGHAGSLRSIVDRLTPTPQQVAILKQKPSAKRSYSPAALTVKASSNGRAAFLREAINAVKAA